MYFQQTKTSDNKNSYSPVANSSSALGLQYKLDIGSVNDPLEAEADAMADRVMRMPDTLMVQRKCSGCEEEEKVQRKPLATQIIPFIQAKSLESNAKVGDGVSSRIESTLGRGNSLPETTKNFMESRFATDFSNVKLHTDAEAVQLSRDLNAQAFTLGNDIYFNSGKYAPDSESGRHLLAHELTHTLQQGKNNRDRVNRKCEVAPALNYYKKTPQGKKIDFAEWMEKMRKVAGTTHKSLYDDAKVTGKIDHSFIILVCKIQQLLNIREDGKIGGTTAIAFNKFATGGEKGIDYTRLFKDKKLEVGIAIGAEFKSEFLAIVTLLETAGKKLKNFSSTGSSGSKLIKFTKEFPVQGDNTAAPVAIDVEFSIIGEDSTTPKKTYTEFLSQKEIVIYSGHARYGTGPDFDEKKSAKENFIIGVNSALHKAGKLSKGYDAHMNKILDGYGNDLEAMSKAGKIDPDKYQVWFFNACSTINYLDEVRNGLVTDKAGKIKSKTNLRFVGTKHSIYSDAIKIVDSILNMKTMDEIISIMDTNEKSEVKTRGEKVESSYYFSD